MAPQITGSEKCLIPQYTNPIVMSYLSQKLIEVVDTNYALRDDIVVNLHTINAEPKQVLSLMKGDDPQREIWSPVMARDNLPIDFDFESILQDDGNDIIRLVPDPKYKNTIPGESVFVHIPENHKRLGVLMAYPQDITLGTMISRAIHNKSHFPSYQMQRFDIGWQLSIKMNGQATISESISHDLIPGVVFTRSKSIKNSDVIEIKYILPGTTDEKQKINLQLKSTEPQVVQTNEGMLIVLKHKDVNQENLWGSFDVFFLTNKQREKLIQEGLQTQE